MFDLIKRSFSDPRIYILVQKTLGATRLRCIAVDEFLAPLPGERILDIGCGPGDILEILPEVDYVGFDTEPGYIDYAKRRYRGRGEFHCELFEERHAAQLASFDGIMLLGVLHHLDDAYACRLLSLLARILKPGGRLVTLDPCFTEDQSKAARWVAMQDRGVFVRNAAGYESLMQGSFKNRHAEIRHNTTRIPSTERLVRLTNPIGGGQPDWAQTPERRSLCL
jgi:SAM-dependent methyltransferase